MSHPYELPVNVKIAGRYRIDKILGAGGFGITYLVYDTLLGQEYALKECFPRELASRNISESQKVFSLPNMEEAFVKYKATFHKEAKILATLPVHSGIVGVHDLISENNTWYIKMEYLQGKTLLRYLNDEGPISPVRMLMLAKAILYALDLVHQKGLLHRDIAPDNIMFLADQSLKLMDFGSAVVLSDGNPSHAIGKPGFTPIEQYDVNNKLTPATDIYALCATIYMMITGVTPDTAPNRLFSIHTGKGDTLKSIRDYIPDISENIDALICKGLQLNEKDRYQSAMEMAEVIEKCLISFKTPITIEYFYDDIRDDSKTETIKCSLYDRISSYKDKTSDGYQLDRTSNFPLTVSFNQNNTIQVFYIKIREAYYTIEYYYDGKLDETQTVSKLGKVGSQVTEFLSCEKTEYALDRIEGLPLIVSTDESQNYIHVFYIKKTVILDEPLINVSVQAALQKAPTNKEPNGEVGDCIVYTIWIQNIGAPCSIKHVELQGVSNCRIDLIDEPNLQIERNETRKLQQNYYIDAKDIKNNQVVCTVKVAVLTLRGVLKTSDASVITMCEKLSTGASIALGLQSVLQKSNNSNVTLAKEGDSIEYTITAKNEGNEAVRDVYLTFEINNRFITEENIDILNAGESKTFIYTHTVNHRDMTSTQLQSKVFASATSNTNQAINSVSTDTIELYPSKPRRLIWPAVIISVFIITFLILAILLPFNKQIDFSGAEFGYYSDSNTYISLGTNINIGELNDQVRVYFHISNTSDKDYPVDSMVIKLDEMIIAQHESVFSIPANTTQVFSSSVRGSGSYTLFINGNSMGQTQLMVKMDP